ncbi:hypothetical protein [Spirosoma agri]|uniref:Uncharacterized protein n=1 Tax=Spirosoma agri TaxID=1987381 RepID=A0A6M0IFC4_9BACT|nr:hypothetical protein [Spirosoma agri]NEU66966.1 hypothetical protein [Spirosoma agri]
MTVYPNKAWTKAQLDQNLMAIDQHVHEPAFNRDVAYTTKTQSLFIELVNLESDLLEQAEQAGKRVDFFDEVGTNGKIQDITSLIYAMRQSVNTINANQNTPETNTAVVPVINHFYGAGNGYFPNGLFFRCDHDDDLAFFVGQDRIYFHRHLVRAFTEAKAYLQATLNKS